MEIILNDIVWRHKCSDKYVAIENIKVAIEILAELRKKDKSFKLYAKEKISGSELAPGYYFGQLFSEGEDVLPRKYKTLIRTYLSNFNKINEDSGSFKIGEHSSEQCGYACSEGKAVFSIITNDIFAASILEGIYENLDGKQIESFLKNISQKEHLEESSSSIGYRIYEENPKHKINYGWGSPMDLNNEEAQIALNGAIQINEDDKHLVSKYKGKYYSFRCHRKNCYHGYQDNGLNDGIKSRLQELYTENNT